NGTATIDADTLQRRLQDGNHTDLGVSLEEVGFHTVVGLLGRFGGRAADLRPWLENAQINRDRNLRLQYLAGMSLNQNLGKSIREDMLRYRRFPDDLFVGTGTYSWALKKILTEPPTKKTDDTPQ
ncbi:MAG TPA: hypothetical protein VFA18_11040, partial [Gemmataceae bacterium]|nr:hypothetical protein [Gemmataceae bacterium]